MKKKGINLTIIITLLMALCLSVIGVSRYSTYNTHQVEVTRVEQPIDNKSKKYLVFTDQGTFQNEDDLFMLKFNSADIRGKIQVGKKYEITTTGMRSGFMSWFPNIVHVNQGK